MSTATFTLFPNLPLELRLRIFSYALTSQSRLVDLWSTQTERTIDSVTLWTTRYQPIITHLPPHPLLHTTRESRCESLRQLSLEFRTVYHSPDLSIEHVEPARWYVNWDVDVFCPRGFWHFGGVMELGRMGWGRLRCLVLDASGHFWGFMREKMKEGKWVFHGLREIWLWDSMPDGKPDWFWRSMDARKARVMGEEGELEGKEVRFVEGWDGSKGVRLAEGMLKMFFARLRGEWKGVGNDEVIMSFSSTAETLVGEERGKTVEEEESDVEVVEEEEEEDDSDEEYFEEEKEEWVMDVEVDPDFIAPVIRRGVLKLVDIG